MKLKYYIFPPLKKLLGLFQIEAYLILPHCFNFPWIHKVKKLFRKLLS
jgi:hypothetical protein